MLWTTHLIDEIADDDQVVILHQGKVLAADTARGQIVAAQGAATIGDAFARLTGVEVQETLSA